MSQFLDPNSQQIVAARFNAQHAANLVAATNFADQLSVADPSQFVTAVQQQYQHQQNNTTQQLHNVANNLNFFQQHQNLSVMGAPVTSSAPNMSAANQHQAHSQPHIDHQVGTHQMDQTIGNQHHFDHQQLACVNVMNADNLTNHLANSGSILFDRAAGVTFQIPHTSVLDASNAIVVNTISGLRQPHHQLQQHQSHHQQQINGHSGVESEHQGISNGHRGHNARGNRSDENGHKRSGNLMVGHTSSVQYNSNSNNNNTGRSPNKSNSVTNQATKSNEPGRANSKCSKTKGANKKIQKPDKNPDPNRRTFSCPECGKGFTENFNMKRHMQIHSHTRPKYDCNECSKSFAWKDNFVRHKKAAHDNVLEPFAM